MLVVAYFGLAHQYFLLRFAARGRTFFGLFLFMAWALPMIGGSIQAMAWGPMRTSESGYPFFALSPIAGIGMVASYGDEVLAYSIRSSALTPALLFTFVFNYLLIGAAQAGHQVRVSGGRESEAGPR